jgi:hypothetical protein
MARNVSVMTALKDEMTTFRTEIDPVALAACIEEGRLDSYLPALRECMVTGEPFVDPFFPAQFASLGEGDAAKKVKNWRRPADYYRGQEPICLISAKTDPSDVIQGELGTSTSSARSRSWPAARTSLRSSSCPRASSTWACTRSDSTRTAPGRS